MIILFNEDCLSMVQNAATWVCGGTFKSAPSGFSQVFIIHFSYYQEFMPLLNVLLPGKVFRITTE